MLRNLILLIAILLYLPLSAQNKGIDNSKSSVSFIIKNAGIEVEGKFKTISGSVDFDEKNPSSGKISATIRAESIDTEIEMRDKHIKDEDYFDVKKYPTLKFASTKIAGSNGKYSITGNLTIKDVTKPITFPFNVTAKNGQSFLKGQFVIDRRDYHVGGNSWVMGDDVIVKLEIATN